MLSVLAALASGVAEGSAELEVSDSHRTRGSLSVAVSFSSDVELLPPRKLFNLPIQTSSVKNEIKRIKLKLTCQ